MQRTSSISICVALILASAAVFAQGTTTGGGSQGGQSSTPAAASGSNGGARSNAGDGQSPAAQAPVRQPRESAPPAAPTNSTRSTPTPATTTQPGNGTAGTPTGTPPAGDASAGTGRQPGVNPANSAGQRRTAEATQPAPPEPPAMRGVGTSSTKPDCSKLRALEKTECERRDSTRDDLPAGVTRTQPER